jgi:diphosphomevalonate decarboxylase
MFTTNDFIPTAYSHNIEGGEFLTAPSNIALVKYWKGQSNSANPSVITLNNCKTITKLVFAKKESTDFSFDLFLKENQRRFQAENPSSSERIYLPS